MLLNSIPLACSLLKWPVFKMMICNNTVYLHGKHFEASSCYSQAENYFILYVVYMKYLFTKNLVHVKMKSVVCFNGIKTIWSFEVMHGLTYLLSKCQRHYLVTLHLSCKSVSIQSRNGVWCWSSLMPEVCLKTLSSLAEASTLLRLSVLGGWLSDGPNTFNTSVCA